MKRTLLSFLLCGVFVTSMLQAEDAKIDTVDDHKGWGWKSVVMSNGLITVATIPEIGARIMQYDLGSHSSIFINPDPKYFGKVLEPDQDDWRNYGGYKVWPAPQSRWSWKPPAQLDAGHYQYEIIDESTDSVSVFVRSPEAVWKKHTQLPGLVIERRAVVYKGTSRVKVEQAMVNTTENEMSWSIWDVTQVMGQHGEEKDFELFWVYFPIKKEGSVFGNSGVETSKSSKAWKGEVAPGIYGVQYQPSGAKIFADSPEGWIAYVDERESYAYFKVFEIWEGETYPDNGARNEVWVNSNPYYIEVEVVSPIWPIPPNGGKITFVEDWYAAKMNGPVKYANHVGAVNRYLGYQNETSELEARYGVFYQGTAKVVFLDESGVVLAEGQTYEVDPMSEFHIDEILEQPEGAVAVEVRVYNSNGDLLGTIESKPVDLLASVAEQISHQPGSLTLAQNYPNPFNPSTTLEYTLDRSQHVTLNVYDMKGREAATLVDQVVASGSHKITWNAAQYSAGIYLARLAGDHYTANLKMILLK